MKKSEGRVAALRKVRDAGTSFEAEIVRGPLSIYERQRILAYTSAGDSAGRIPIGHHDDSSGRFRVDPDDAEPRVVQFHPDEEATPEELAAVNASERWRRLLAQHRPVGSGLDEEGLGFALCESDAPASAIFERVRAAGDVTCHALAAAELGLSPRQVRARITSANGKAFRRAQRLRREIEGGDSPFDVFPREFAEDLLATMPEEDEGE